MSLQSAVPLLDLKPQYQSLRVELQESLLRVMESQQFILGPEVEELEAEIAAYCGVRHAVGCASGSDALLLALMAAGVRAGDEVLTVPFTFFATAGAIVRLGATPVFVDVDERTFNLDVQQAAELIRKRPAIRAVIPVHLFGQCADMEPLNQIAAERGITVIEDAAQAIGAEYHGRRAGGLGNMGCFSFFPSKNLGGFGDGGIITTNDAELAVRLKALRVHGERERYFHEWVGINSRLDALQAAVLRVKLKHLDGWSARRAENADYYREELTDLASDLRLPDRADYATRHVYNQFTVRCRNRDQLKSWLEARGIGCAIYYPLPLHLQRCFGSLGYGEGDFPVSEKLAREVLSLPIYPELKRDQIQRVSAEIRAFYSQS